MPREREAPKRDDEGDPAISGLKRQRESTQQQRQGSKARFWFEKADGDGDGSAILPRSILFAAVLGGLVGAVVVFVGILALTTMVSRGRGAAGGIESGGSASRMESGGGGPLTILLSEFPGQLGLGLESAIQDGEAGDAGDEAEVAVPGSVARQLRRELEALKVRNRLSLLADRAIADADRRAYEQLRAALGSPELEEFRYSIGSELMRVQFFYASGSRLKGFELPVAELFPDDPAGDETSIAPDKVARLLLDLDRSWQVRGRAAWILGGREPDDESLAALVEGVRTDPNLDVLKECLYSIEELTGLRGRELFDTDTVLEWWEQYRNGPPHDLAGAAEAKRPRATTTPEVAPEPAPAPVP